jgi:hypothetical protein
MCQRFIFLTPIPEGHHACIPALIESMALAVAASSFAPLLMQTQASRERMFCSCTLFFEKLFMYTDCRQFS